MAGDKTRIPDPASGPAGDTQMKANIDFVLAQKNRSNAFADNAKIVLEQAKVWLTTITPT